MFTGIIKELGIVKNFGRCGRTYRLGVESKRLFEGLKIGDSAAVNGVCLTLVEKEGRILYFDIMEETIRRTNLQSLKAGSLVNMEGALKMSDGLDGHFVLGHIDCVGDIQDIKRKENELSVQIGIPQDFAHLVVEKGSVAIDGISLTVAGVSAVSFTVCIIPHTLKETTLGLKKPADKVNVEFDIIGKHVARLGRYTNPAKKLTGEFLKEKGF